MELIRTGGPLILCDLFWVAWTEFGGVGEGRRAVLGKSDKSSQGSGHPGLDPVICWWLVLDSCE
jgi:hypothetical protein